MDKAYGRSKKALDKSGKLMTTVETLKKEVTTLKRQLENIQIEIIRAREDKDAAKEKALKKSAETPMKELNAKKEQLKKLEETVKKNQATIDEKMTELSKDPNLKAHLDEVIGKKFSRKLAKIQKDKEEKVKQTEILTKIKEAAQKDPNVMYSLKEIEKYTISISKLQSIIADPSKSLAEKTQAQTDLTSARNSLESSRSSLARYFKGTISRDVIDKITSYEDLGKEIKSNIKYIKGTDKQIANYQTALENIGYELPARDDSSSDRSDDSSRSTRTVGRRPAPSTDLPAEQPKWYQFIKRFKNWNARRKVNTEEQPAPVSQEEKKKFKDSMKYDVVKDYEEKVATDLLKQAKSQNRQPVDRDRE